VAVAGLGLAQVTLGFLSVYFRLAVVPVSVHTLLAAGLLTLLTAMTSATWAPPVRDGTVLYAERTSSTGSPS
jgi:heme A synthase